MKTNIISGLRAFVAALALVASFVFTPTAFAQKGDVGSPENYPTVPMAVAVRGRAMIMSHFIPQFERVQLYVGGQSVIGQEDLRQVVLSHEKLLELGYAGTFESFRKAITKVPLGVDVVPINGEYEVEVFISTWVKGFDRVIMNGSAWLEIHEGRGGNLEVVSARPYLNLVPEYVNVVDSGIESAVWVAEQYVAQPQYFYDRGEERSGIAFPISILDSGTLVASLDQNGERRTVAITLGESSVTVTDSEQIRFVLGNARSGEVIVLSDLTLGVQDEITFWRDEEARGVIRGRFPLIEHAPSVVGVVTTFNFPVRVWNGGGRETISPASLLVRNITTGEEEVLLPGSDGMFNYKFRANTYHIIASFERVLDWAVRVDPTKG